MGVVSQPEYVYHGESYADRSIEVENKCLDLGRRQRSRMESTS